VSAAKKILVLGCEPNIRVVAGQYLQRDGHAAVPAADGTKAPSSRTPNRAKKWRRSRSPVRVRACPKDLPHVFERSYKEEKSRTREGIKGNPDAGLELAKARGLIELHGGGIDVESGLGHGIASDLP
jgi:hypothetical protein